MKDHLYFKNPQEGVTIYKQKPRNPGSTEKSDEDKDFEINYDFKKSNFSRSLLLFTENRSIRKERKTIEVPNEIDLIWIKFYNIFDSSIFEKYYYRDFGLEIVTYSNWNTEAIFAIVNSELFDQFITNLEFFVNNEVQDIFNTNILYIKEFDFLSSNKRTDVSNLNVNVFLNLIDLNEFLYEFENILQSLILYLNVLLSDKNTKLSDSCL